MITRRQVLQGFAALTLVPGASLPGAAAPGALAWARALRLRPAGDSGSGGSALALALGDAPARALGSLHRDCLSEVGCEPLAGEEARAEDHELGLLLLGDLGRGDRDARAVESSLASLSPCALSVVVATEKALFLGSAAKAGGPTARLACDDGPAGFRDAVTALASPLLRRGFVGFDPEDLRAVAGSGGRIGRVLRIPLGDWSSPLPPPALPAACRLDRPGGGRLRGLAITILGDHRDPKFTLSALSRWVEGLLVSVPGDAEVVFTSFHEPQPPRALACAFFDP